MFDDDAFIRTLTDEHGTALSRYALHLAGGDHQRAEDIVQETMVRAWRNPEALLNRPPRPWLFAVARNIAIDRHRAALCRPVEVMTDAPEPRPAGDDTDRILEGWAIAEALMALKPDHRNVLIETYYRGSSIATAAAKLGIPEGTVKSRMYYALKALRLELQERGLAPATATRRPETRGDVVEAEIGTAP